MRMRLTSVLREGTFFGASSPSLNLRNRRASHLLGGEADRVI